MNIMPFPDQGPGFVLNPGIRREWLIENHSDVHGPGLKLNLFPAGIPQSLTEGQSESKLQKQPIRSDILILMQERIMDSFM